MRGRFRKRILVLGSSWLSHTDFFRTEYHMNYLLAQVAFHRLVSGMALSWAAAWALVF